MQSNLCRHGTMESFYQTLAGSFYLLKIISKHKDVNCLKEVNLYNLPISTFSQIQQNKINRTEMFCSNLST